MLLSLPINCQTESTKDQALQLLLAVQVNAGWRELPDAGDRLWRKRRAARTVARLAAPCATFSICRLSLFATCPCVPQRCNYHEVVGEYRGADPYLKPFTPVRQASLHS